MRINTFFSKLLIIFAVLLATYFYARYERNKYYDNGQGLVNEQVLKRLPIFSAVDSLTGKNVSSSELLKGNSGLFVHIWGTWCAPCEKEMPVFLNYAQSLQDKGLKFLLVAVNDDEVKVKKFMGRFSLPSNVTVVIDKANVVMDLFGTLKVPESFLFDSNGKHISKFVGPQNWEEESFKTRLNYWLNLENLEKRKIETH